MTADGDEDGAMDDLVIDDAAMVVMLSALGVSAGDIVNASASGLLPMLLVDAVILPDLSLDIDEVAAASDLGIDRIRSLWGALGFAAPRAGERIFSATDVEQFRAVAELVDSGLASPEVVIQMTRVLGASMARVAAAQADVIANRGTVEGVDTGDIGVGWFGETFAAVLEQVWRRHLQAAVRARLTAPSGPESPTTAVGFADLVGFTALSQQLDTIALAAVVERFETVAYATVGAHGGRVVKMIGDEVMFTVDDPVAAVACALDLAESYHEADDLSDVRVGVAYGTVIDRDGDLYGPTVNLASRVTAIALPSSVVIDDELRQMVEAEADLSFRTLLPRRLKHIGLVRLHVVRRVDENEDDHRAQRRERRRARIGEIARAITPLSADAHEERDTDDRLGEEEE